ncbi:hypothetical protein ADIARSV_0146 [Arcticibacter svalbardensis MN12-7]|uniref:DUF5681 domain-containing protein n=1 Tax=Arcticibacter svalbardensis MN12-7 TaxID=1150600 RepID=R9GYK2_9SPHI|nr:hypothetical protein [Arcticibacter svalbardensis]EOR96723.1 hypothetical protein ADIARSV_0146 [Arcticibacter svalbardensis MN12-7]
MKYEKGTSGNPNGRPLKERKVSIQGRIMNLIEKNFEAIEQEVTTAAPTEKVNILITLASLAMPINK